MQELAFEQGVREPQCGFETLSKNALNSSVETAQQRGTYKQRSRKLRNAYSPQTTLMNRDGAGSRDRTTPSSSLPPEENDEEVDLYSGIELQRSASMPKKSDARRQTTIKTHANGSNLTSSVTGLAPDAHLGVTRETATSGRVPEAASRLSPEDDAVADHDESEPSSSSSDDDDDDVDIILGSSQPALGEQAAQFAASWNEVARDMQPSAERTGPAVGLGMISTEASLQSAAVLNSMLPEPTMKNIAPGRQKSLYEVELEQLDEKPWREPGAVLSDYFNYGFTEETWKIYCQHQAAMRQETTFLQRQVTGNASTTARERDKGARGTLATAGSGTNSSTLRDRQRRPGDEDKAKQEPKETTKSSEKHPGTSWKMAGSSASILPSKDVLERLAQVRNQIMSKAAPSQVKDSTTSGIGRRETTSARRSGAGTTRSVSERQQPSSSERERKRKRNHDDRPADTADDSS